MVYSNSENENVPMGGITVAAVVEVTGMYPNDNIAAMFDSDDSTIWHATKLNDPLRSSVKLTFTVSVY